MTNSCCMSQTIAKHCQLVQCTAKNSMSHRKMFVSALFKTVFHLIFNAKIMSILEITFGISFSCNGLDLTDIISKTENALSTAIYQSEVRQLEKKTHQIYSTAICIDMFVHENSPNHPKRTPKPAFPTTNNLMSPNTPTKHLSTRYGPAHDTLVLIAYSQKFYLIC